MSRVARVLIALLLASDSQGATLVSNLTANPATLNIISVSPASGSPSTNASVGWSVLLSLLPGNWTLSVQAASSSFGSCPNVPLNAVTVTCSSITDTGIIGASHSCAGPFALSTSNRVLASGSEFGGVIGTRTVAIQFAFADSWKFPGTATPCNLAVNYTLVAM